MKAALPLLALAAFTWWRASGVPYSWTHSLNVGCTWEASEFADRTDLASHRKTDADDAKQAACWRNKGLMSPLGADGLSVVRIVVRKWPA